MADMEEIVIDFTNSENLSEFDMFAMWRGQAKILMDMLFGPGGFHIPVKIKGSPGQVASFSRALNKEKRYLQSWRDNGLNDEKTWKRKADLDRAVRSFTSKTGLKWPFK